MGFEHIKSINNPKEVANEGKQSWWRIKQLRENYNKRILLVCILS